MDRKLVIPLLLSDLFVALRKESVDRKVGSSAAEVDYYVALRKESVDRKFSLMKFSWNLIRRSPQGERG